VDEKQLLELLERYSPAIRDAILAGIRDIRDNARLNEIVAMIEQRNIEGALRALGYNPAVFNTYHSMMVQAFQQGGMMMIAMQPKYTPDSDGLMTMLRFNVRDPAAERWLAERSSALVTNIEEDVRLAVRDTLREGMEEGRNPRSVALDLVGRYNSTTGHREGGIVGLGEREQTWARNVRQKLLMLDASYFGMKLRDKRFDGIVRKAIAEGKPLTADQVTKLTDRYRDRALKHRGDTIGRTEALAALNRSEYEATKQALAQSNLPSDAAAKIWDAKNDNLTRHSHREMDGQRVGIEEAFVSPVTGARLLHPGDTTLGATGKDVIACRCRIRYDIRWGAGLK